MDDQRLTETSSLKTLPFERGADRRALLAQAGGPRLKDRRVLGTRIVVEVPHYSGCTVAARVRAQPNTRAQTVSGRAVDALYRYFHPLLGGPDGRGWPFGRTLHVGEVY